MCFVQRRVLVSISLFVGVVLVVCTQPAPALAPAVDISVAPVVLQVERGWLLIVGGGCYDCYSLKKFDIGAFVPDLSCALLGHLESAGVLQFFKQGIEKVWTMYANDHLTVWSGAWGVLFAANLMSDNNTGIGIWIEQMFVDAIKQGKYMGTSWPILLLMLWSEYRYLLDEDFKAMFAYLKSILVIANRVLVLLISDGKSIDDVQ